MKKRFLAAVLGVSGVVLAEPAFAAGGPDFTTLTSAVDFSTATTAIMSIFGLLAVVYVAMKGGSMIMSVLRSKS